MQTSDAIKVITVRTTGFDPAPASRGSGAVATVEAVANSGISRFVGAEIARLDRQELTAARIVVSGGRALGSFNRVDRYMRDSGAGITHTLPMVMGLDGAGAVEEIDGDERTLRVGQCVAVHPGIACGRCEFCLRGDDTLCTSMRPLGDGRPW